MLTPRSASARQSFPRAPGWSSITFVQLWESPDRDPFSATPVQISLSRAIEEACGKMRQHPRHTLTSETNFAEPGSNRDKSGSEIARMLRLAASPRVGDGCAQFMERRG